jgi:hypothetical protein
MRRFLFVLSSLLILVGCFAVSRFVPFVHATTIFSDGFESGNFSAWSGNYGGTSVQNSTVHTGTYAMKATGTGDNYAAKTITTAATVYLRCYVYYTAFPSVSGQPSSFLSTVAPGFAQIIARVKNSSGTIYWEAYYSGSTQDASFGPSLNTWYCVEILGSSSGWKMWVNGTLILSGTLASGSVTKLEAGSWDNNGGSSSTDYIDDVIASDSYNGPMAPTCSNISASSTSVGLPCQFSSYWTAYSPAALSGYIFGTNNTGSWVNQTWTSLSGTTAWENVTATICNTVGVIVQYEWWTNDTLNVWANSGLQSLTTTPQPFPPTFGSVGTNTTQAGLTCTFSCLVNDIANVSSYIFSTNNTGTWINNTAVLFSSFFNGSAAWANVTQTLSNAVGNVVGYMWYANDTSNNWANSGQYVLTVTVPTPTLQLSPSTQTCSVYGENFTTQLVVTNAYTVTDFKFEVCYNTTLLTYSSITWNAWGSGTVTVDMVDGTITGTTSGTAVNGTQTLVTIQFTATYYRIWKDQSVVSGWQNNQSGLIYIQWANLSYATGPDLSYMRGGTQNQINVGPDFTYTFAPIQGDVNNDGTVNILDLRTVAAFYDVKLGDPAWPLASVYDLNGDGVINIFDLIYIATNWGYTSP